jgi:hypothetical protein
MFSLNEVLLNKREKKKNGLYKKFQESYIQDIVTTNNKLKKKERRKLIYLFINLFDKHAKLNSHFSK